MRSQGLAARPVTVAAYRPRATAAGVPPSTLGRPPGEGAELRVGVFQAVEHMDGMPQTPAETPGKESGPGVRQCAGMIDRLGQMRPVRAIGERMPAQPSSSKVR